MTIFAVVMAFESRASAEVDDLPDETLTIFAHAQPTPIDWTSATSTVQSTASNYLFNLLPSDVTVLDPDGQLKSQRIYERAPHPIGHLAVGLKCSGREPILTGQTSTGSDFTAAFFNHPYLHDLILADDWLGVLDSRLEIRHGIDIARRQGRLAFLRFRIDHETCERLTQYLNGYKAAGLHLSYGGLASDPLQDPNQGAGCAVFGVNFVKVAGFLTEEMANQWRRWLRVPLPGQEGCPTCKTTSQLLAGVFSPWPTASEPHRTIHFYDPESVYESLDAIRSSLGSQAANGVWLNPDSLPLLQGLKAESARYIHDPADGKIFGFEIDVSRRTYTPQAALPKFDPSDLQDDVIARRKLASVSQAKKVIRGGWGPAGLCEELRFARKGTRYQTSMNSACVKGKEYYSGCDLRDYNVAQTCRMWFDLVE
jgi:hypothetical protein